MSMLGLTQGCPVLIKKFLSLAKIENVQVAWHLGSLNCTSRFECRHTIAEEALFNQNLRQVEMEFPQGRSLRWRNYASRSCYVTQRQVGCAETLQCKIHL